MTIPLRNEKTISVPGRNGRRAPLSVVPLSGQLTADKIGPQLLEWPTFAHGVSR
jgi:hypothetical protein